MAKKSAGLLLYRNSTEFVEVFLVHPGGPFWSKKDEGAWSIPKGEFVEGEEALEVAKREFNEETSFSIEGSFEAMQPIRQPSGKIVYAWTVEGDIDASAIRSRLDGPKEWKDQFEAHSGNLTAMEAQRLAGLPRVKSKGLCDRFLLGHFIVILIFRGGLLGAV
jgi:predicted NUDIX family NTP pyrophosphohydrolase